MTDRGRQQRPDRAEVGRGPDVLVHPRGLEIDEVGSVDRADRDGPSEVLSQLLHRGPRDVQQLQVDQQRVDQHERAPAQPELGFLLPEVAHSFQRIGQTCDRGTVDPRFLRDLAIAHQCAIRTKSLQNSQSLDESCCDVGIVCGDLQEFLHLCSWLRSYYFDRLLFDNYRMRLMRGFESLDLPLRCRGENWPLWLKCQDSEHFWKKLITLLTHPRSERSIIEGGWISAP